METYILLHILTFLKIFMLKFHYNLMIKRELMKISNFKNTITTLFGFAAPTYYRWKKEKRPIVNLLEKYFSDLELEEFVLTGKINRLEKENIQNDFFSKYKNIYFSYIQKFGLIINLEEEVQEYYFSYLFFIKNNYEKFNIHNNPFSAAAIEFSLIYNKKIDHEEIKNFHLLIDLINFLDNQPGMWFYFTHILQNNFEEWISHIEDIEDYKINNKFTDNFEKKKLPMQKEGLDHFYLFHCYNNIPPYTIQEMK